MKKKFFPSKRRHKKAHAKCQLIKLLLSKIAWQRKTLHRKMDKYSLVLHARLLKIDSMALMYILKIMNTIICGKTIIDW